MKPDNFPPRTAFGVALELARRPIRCPECGLAVFNFQARANAKVLQDQSIEMGQPISAVGLCHCGHRWDLEGDDLDRLKEAATGTLCAPATMREVT